jgi:hypothetical protein
LTSEIQLLQLINKYSRFSQSSLADYFFMSDLKHKEVEMALFKKKDAPDYAEKLKVKISELDDYLDEFNQVIDKTYEFLKEYFSKEYCSKRSEIPLRFSLKVIADDQIVSLRRCPACQYEDVESRTSDNSAFEELRNGRREFYLCNSIPEAIANDDYKNNRIDIGLAKKYYSKIKSREIDKNNKNLLDKEWVSCWKKVKSRINGLEEDPPFESCYRSTIVLPMSLELESLSSQFRNFFHLIQNPVRDQVKNGKAILGFLCLDHPEENFFNEDTDLEIGYVFANTLSLYIIPQLMYTQYSQVYFRSLSSLGEI